MIAKIAGKLVEKSENALLLNVGGVCYEILVPASVLQRVDDHVDENGMLELITYTYIQISPSQGTPVLIGFLSVVEREFFLQFIKVSGIGPRAAVKALSCPISDISRAINDGDQQFLKKLPGIGLQKAKEIVAKLQGKVGKYGLIQDQVMTSPVAARAIQAVQDWQKEALDVLMQLQYKRQESQDMIQKALARRQDIATTEELLNEIYKQRTNP